MSVIRAFLGYGGFPRLFLVSKPPLVIHGYSPVNGSLSGTKLAAFILVILLPVDWQLFRRRAASLAGVEPPTSVSKV